MGRESKSLQKLLVSLARRARANALAWKGTFLFSVDSLPPLTCCSPEITVLEGADGFESPAGNSGYGEELKGQAVPVPRGSQTASSLTQRLCGNYSGPLRQDRNQSKLVCPPQNGHSEITMQATCKIPIPTCGLSQFRSLKKQKATRMDGLTA